MYHNATSVAPVGHHDNRVCVDCHPHRKGFPSFTTVFNPIKRKLFAWFGAGAAYAKPPAWVTDGALPPSLQNHSLPPQAWANGLKRFRAGYEVVRRSSAQAQSGQPAIKDDIIYYYHNDHLGTPCFLTDEAGAIVWRREQTPFGVTSFERGTTAESLRFPGQYWDDEKQSSYNGFRDSYTPGLGRYTQADPIGIKGGINNYGYVKNSPVVYIDPEGLWRWHGNWGGPSWTGGQEGTYNEVNKSKCKPPIDKQDDCYKNHDICYGSCRDNFPCGINNGAGRAACYKQCDSVCAGCLRNLGDDPSNNAKAKVAAWYFEHSNPGNDCPH